MKSYFLNRVPTLLAFLDEHIIEGKIDSLSREGGGWVIVDYKTDDVSDDALKQRFQSYQEQDLWYYSAVRVVARERVTVRTLLKNQ